MKNADMPAMPLEVADDGRGGRWWSGLTKREMMAMHIMCGCIAGGHLKVADAKRMPELAVLMADELIKGLDRTSTTQRW